MEKENNETEFWKAVMLGQLKQEVIELGHYIGDRSKKQGLQLNSRGKYETISN